MGFRTLTLLLGLGLAASAFAHRDCIEEVTRSARAYGFDGNRRDVRPPVLLLNETLGRLDVALGLREPTASPVLQGAPLPTNDAFSFSFPQRDGDGHSLRAVTERFARASRLFAERDGQDPSFLAWETSSPVEARLFVHSLLTPGLLENARQRGLTELENLADAVVAASQRRRTLHGYGWAAAWCGLAASLAYFQVNGIAQLIIDVGAAVGARLMWGDEHRIRREVSDLSRERWSSVLEGELQTETEARPPWIPVSAALGLNRMARAIAEPSGAEPYYELVGFNTDDGWHLDLVVRTMSGTRGFLPVRLGVYQWWSSYAYRTSGRIATSSSAIQGEPRSTAAPRRSVSDNAIRADQAR